MDDVIQLVGPHHALSIFGVKLVGANAENGKKFVFTLVFLLIVLLLVWALRGIARMYSRGTGRERAGFWARQAINLFGAVLAIFGLASIWFDDPTRMTTALGLVSAGLAFALQRVITAMAGYFVILRGKTFGVGDRIVMGGVRGDVIALDFTQTSIMEMGQPPPVQKDAPAVWVESRQYTGRVVTVSNARIFDEPVYNYTREFPFLWEEMHIPVPYGTDVHLAERILLEIATRHGVKLEELGEQALREMHRRYLMSDADVSPRVFLRLTDNWIELALRFLAREHGTRELKDAMSREILRRFESAGLRIASSTLELGGSIRVPVESKLPPEDSAQGEVRLPTSN